MNTINDWSEMDAAAVAGVDPSTITIAPEFAAAVLAFEPCREWAVEPRLTFYWGACKVARAAVTPFKFEAGMYGVPAGYRSTNDSNDQGEA